MENLDPVQPLHLNSDNLNFCSMYLQMSFHTLVNCILSGFKKSSPEIKYLGRKMFGFVCSVHMM